MVPAESREAGTGPSALPGSALPWRGRVYVAMQGLLGRPLGPLLRQLEERERLSPEAFAQFRRTALRDILEYAHAHVALYRTGPWKDALSAGGVGDIRCWPLLGKEVLRERYEDLRAEPAPKSVVIRRTSGSTGKRLKVLSTPEADVWGWAHRYRGLMWHGLPIGVPSLRMTHVRRPLRDLVKGEICVPSLETPELVEQALHYLRDKQPRLVAGPPSVLFHFARHLGERGVTAPLAPFARSGGEQCFDFQRREIESRLSSRVIDSYGCNETGAIAGECPAGSLHVYADHVHVEIFDDGQPAKTGTMGEIVVTALRNRAMPLVRYPVGDRGMLSDEPCRCGLPHPVLARVQARSADMIRTADGRLRHASELVGRLGTILAEPWAAKVRQFRMVKDDAGRWEVWLETPAGFPDSNNDPTVRKPIDERIAGVVREFCGDGEQVSVRFATSIPRANGKLQYFAIR